MVNKEVSVLKFSWNVVTVCNNTCGGHDGMSKQRGWKEEHSAEIDLRFYKEVFKSKAHATSSKGNGLDSFGGGAHGIPAKRWHPEIGNARILQLDGTRGFKKPLEERGRRNIFFSYGGLRLEDSSRWKQPPPTLSFSLVPLNAAARRLRRKW
ncbi:hypothetical protein LR48_Vigan09g093000 [Vigna angularis]|uniref:Uncharacterized protein n=1 Tax=Phaseolus angularis TaxID=3914 RepID=A0A0L9VB27_PHAAN|nr:hypothetical protein LR48_Vigan09g093000 [Vigna angularis]